MAHLLSCDQISISSSTTYFEEPDQYNGPKNVYGTQYISGNASVINGDVYLPRRMTYEQRQKRLEILDWLSPVSFRSFHEAVRQEAGLEDQNPLSTSDNYAGRWLIDSVPFKRWEAQELHNLWYHGMPGAGKTVLASTVIEHLSQSTPSAESAPPLGRLAYLYLKYTHPLSVEDLLGSLVRQIAQEADSLPKSLLNYYAAEQNKGGHKSAPDLSKLLAALSLQQHVYIVVDGLDEYDPKNRPRLIRLLQPSHLPCSISLLFTSRMVHDFEQLSQGFECYNIVANTQDIGLFIDREFGASARLQKFSSKDPALQEDIRGQISNRCSGMFLLAGMHMKTLQNRLTLGQVRKSLRELPSELGSTYDLAMQRVMGQDTDKRTLAVNVFGWVLHASSPMTLLELQHALATSVEDGILDQDGLYSEEDIRDACTGLVTVSQSVVTFVHFTTLNYFRSDACQKLLGTNFHTTIASKCCVYLSLTSQGQPRDERQQKDYIYNLCYFSRSYNIATDDFEVDNGYRWSNQKPPAYPFAGYAARHLAHHMRQINEDDQTGHVLRHVKPLLASEMKRSFLFRMLCCLRRYNTFSTFSNPITATKGLSFEKVDSSATHGVPSGLHLAAFWGWSPLVDRLLCEGNKVDVVDITGRTPIVVAIQEGHLSIVSMLLDKGATIDLSSPQGRHALIHAAQHDQRNLVDCVITRTLTVFGMDDKMAQPESMNKGHYFLHIYLLLVIQYLLVLLGISFYEKEASSGSDSSKDVDSNSLSRELRLLSSAGTGDTEAVQDLVKSKSFSATREEFTLEKVALFLAVEFGHVTTAQALIEGGVGVNTTDLWGNTSLHRAALRNDLAMVKMLLEHDCTTDVLNDRGFTAWSATIRAAEEHSGQNVLNDKLAVLDALRKAGADPNLVDVEGCSQLYTAAAGGNAEKVAYLLELGVNPSWQTQFLWTPLHWAAANGHLNVVRMLLTAGAKPSPLSDTYRTPLDMAQERSQDAIANVLIAAGAETSRELSRKLQDMENEHSHGDEDEDEDENGDEDV